MIEKESVNHYIQNSIFLLILTTSSRTESRKVGNYSWNCMECASRSDNMMPGPECLVYTKRQSLNEMRPSPLSMSDVNVCESLW